MTEYNLGVSLNDKRGGAAIHSWDLELKGSVNENQRRILDDVITHRRHKMNDMRTDCHPVPAHLIHTKHKDADKDIDDLVEKGYLVRKHGKDGELMYDIAMGQLSYEVTRLLDGDCVCPTIVPADIKHIGIIVKMPQEKPTHRTP